MEYNPPIQVPIMVTSDKQLAAVYAVLAGQNVLQVKYETSAKPCPPELEQHVHEPAANEAEPGTAEAAEVEVDSAGAPFDPDVHTGTKLKDGTWRVKKGMADKAAELVPSSDAQSESQGAPASLLSADIEGAPEESNSDEDDEFAAFKAAAAESEAVAATAEAPVREWTDADLSSLLNQAALKLGGPEKIKEVMAEFVPEGVVVHSRHVPVERREEFAQRIEKLADIEFAG